MDRINSRISQVYGYAVCLITVVVMLIAIKQVVDAAFDLSDPIRADGGGYGRMGRPITNFELYKMEARRQGPTRNGPTPAGEKASSDSAASDAELKTMYDAEREAAEQAPPAAPVAGVPVAPRHDQHGPRRAPAAGSARSRTERGREPTARPRQGSRE